MIQIIVDFNSMMQDPAERVVINVDTQPQIAKHLQNGKRVLLCDTDLEVEGNLEFDSNYNTWLAVPDWSTQRDV